MSAVGSTVPEGITVPREAVTEEELAELGVDLDRDFPGSTAADFRRYPVLSEGGWYLVVKHQKTLRCVSREPWRLLGPIELTSDGLDVE
ncbi:hypothetical protein [Thermocrispum municipale]|mgnify:CR=1 FL=1|jgi:hypothetical protein|uniref:hypothetical protein n=1 Tax=Thermocrispum municipale TaxID=37926 RepID=UPI0003FFDFBD|nr:hypothetical protein [Thermocrispum municipale]